MAKMKLPKVPEQPVPVLRLDAIANLAHSLAREGRETLRELNARIAAC
jgi:hypothetical protein